MISQLVSQLGDYTLLRRNRLAFSPTITRHSLTEDWEGRAKALLPEIRGLAE